MNVDTISRALPAPTVDFESSAWSGAEILDEPAADGITLRALVCPVESGKWQWSISALGGDSGDLISTGIEASAAKARRTAMSELAKCLEDPLA
jgi:hypothetical protein